MTAKGAWTRGRPSRRQGLPPREATGRLAQQVGSSTLAAAQRTRRKRFDAKPIINWHGKALFTAACAILAWLTLAATIWRSECQLDALTVGFIELANGATWPTGWHDVCVHNPGSFALALAARTALNFAGPLLVIVTGVWFLTGGLERLMQMTRTQLMQQLSAELVASLHALVTRRHPETRPERLAEELKEMQAVAADVVTEFVRDSEELESRAKRRSAVR